MSGLVGSLRSQTTQERLRSDHIMTLELFQATVDENAELKLELGRLKAKLASSSADTEEGEVEDGESAKSGGATLVQKVLKQEKELKDLREEVKVLKAKGVQDEMTIAKLTKSNSSNEALKRQLDHMLKEAAERDAREAAEREVKQPVVELHDHNECLATITALNESMLKSERGHLEKKEKLEMELLKQSATNSSLLDGNKVLQEENEELKNSLANWECKYKELQKARDLEERSLKDKIHASDLQMVKMEQEAANHLGANALLIELDSVKAQRYQLEVSNNEQQVEIKRLKKRIEQLEEDSSGANPLLLPAASPVAAEPTQDSAFFLTMAQSSSASALPSANVGGTGFAEFVALKKENKSLKAQLQQLTRGAPILSGVAKGVAPGAFLANSK